MACQVSNILDETELKKIFNLISQRKKVELFPTQTLTLAGAKMPVLTIGQYHGLLIYTMNHSYNMALSIGLNITRPQKDKILRQCLTQLTANYRITRTRNSIILKPRNDIPSNYGYALSFYKKNAKLRIHTDYKVAVFDTLRIFTLGYRSFLRSVDHYLNMLSADISGINSIIQATIDSILYGINIDPTINLTTIIRALPSDTKNNIDSDNDTTPAATPQSNNSPPKSKKNTHESAAPHLEKKPTPLVDPPWKVKEAKYDDKGHIKGLMERIKNTLVDIPPHMTFEMIGGCQEAKDELNLLTASLKKSELFHKWGVKPVKGIILYGPPGTGKTMLIQALANETESRLFSATVADISSKWIGDQELLINLLFDYAEINSPSIILFDEIDSLCPDRGHVDEWYRRIVSIILQRMDGFQKNKNVVVVGTTNYLQSMDQALLRPGRFDKIIEIPLPAAQARENIFKIHCNKKRIRNINYPLLAEKAEGLSGADIQAVVQLALEKKLREELYHQKKPRYVVNADLFEIIEKYAHARMRYKEKSSTQIYV